MINRIFIISTEIKKYLFSVEMVFLCGILGLGIGFPVASLQRHIKPYYINLIACLGSVTGFLLLWTATLYNGWFWDKAGVLAMYNFLAGKLKIFCHCINKSLKV